MAKSPERFATPHTLSDCQFCWDTLFVLFNVIGLFEAKMAILCSQWQVAFWLIDSFLSTCDHRSSIGIVNHSICYTSFLVHPRRSPDFTVFFFFFWGLLGDEFKLKHMCIEFWYYASFLDHPGWKPWNIVCLTVSGINQMISLSFSRCIKYIYYMACVWRRYNARSDSPRRIVIKLQGIILP